MAMDITTMMAMEASGGPNGDHPPWQGVPSTVFPHPWGRSLNVLIIIIIIIQGSLGFARIRHDSRGFARIRWDFGSQVPGWAEAEATSSSCLGPPGQGSHFQG